MLLAQHICEKDPGPAHVECPPFNLGWPLLEKHLLSNFYVPGWVTGTRIEQINTRYFSHQSNRCQVSGHR